MGLADCSELCTVIYETPNKSAACALPTPRDESNVRGGAHLSFTRPVCVSRTQCQIITIGCYLDSPLHLDVGLGLFSGVRVHDLYRPGLTVHHRMWLQKDT